MKELIAYGKAIAHVALVALLAIGAQKLLGWNDDQGQALMVFALVFTLLVEHHRGES